MKKILFAVLLSASIITCAYAKDTNNVSYRVMTDFKTKFASAENVNWVVKDNFTRASFNIKGEKLNVFYDINGDMIGTSKNISLDELPTDAKRTFAKVYSGYTVNEAIHFEGVDEDAYYISAGNGKHKVILKVTNNRNVSTFQWKRRK